MAVVGGSVVGGGGFTSIGRAVVVRGGPTGTPVPAIVVSDAVTPIAVVLIVVLVVVMELSIFLPLLLMYSSTASRISLRIISYDTKKIKK